MACFGDDLGDLAAFAALDRFAALGVDVTKVAVVDAESPPQVAAAADLVVEGPAGALTVLEQLSEA
jgi:trehalose 6-phosphate phosphatase